MRGRKTLLTVAAVAAVAMLLVPGAAVADHAAGGSTAGSPIQPACGLSAECLAFIAACNPALAVRNGAQTSIVAIGDVAGSTRTFSWTATAGSASFGGIARAVAAVRLLNSACNDIGGISAQNPLPAGSSRSISIPSSARWLVFLPQASAGTSWRLR